MSRFERSEAVQRAMLLKRWIEATAGALPMRTKNRVLWDLSTIIRPSSWSREAPEEAPLFGLDPQGFIEQLHSPNGGAVRHVKGIGPAMIAELRQALPQPGSPAILEYVPPAHQRTASSLLSRDQAVAMLDALWDCLEPRERLRTLELAADLVLERLQGKDDLASVEDKAIAEEIKRRTGEAQRAGRAGMSAE